MQFLTVGGVYLKCNFVSTVKSKSPQNKGKIRFMEGQNQVMTLCVYAQFRFGDTPKLAVTPVPENGAFAESTQL
jgi:hypothetical protein